jgi:hypothetical protein
MKPTHDRLPGEACPGVVRPTWAPWEPVRLSGAVMGRCLGVAHLRLGRSPGGL